MKFNLGQTVMTRGVADKIARDEEFAKFVVNSMGRYKKGDWGDLCEDDKKMNDDAIANGDDRILASYIFDPNDDDTFGEGKIYIITEWDRSATTILFPSEY